MIDSNDNLFTHSLKEKYTHSQRSFYYNGIKRMVDCLYCHATPGTIETVLTELTTLKKKFTSQANLLNMGGGSGQVSSLFSETGFSVFNIDIDLEKEDEHNKRFDLNSEKTHPFKDETFQVVVCEEIIEHIENPWKLFRDAYDSLEKEGFLIITTPNVLSLRDRLYFLKTGYFSWFVPQYFDFHINPLFFWELDLIGKRTGFKLEKVLGSGDYYFARNKEMDLKKILRKNEGVILVFKK